MKYLYFTYHTNDAVYLIVTYDRCNFQDQDPSYKKSHRIATLTLGSRDKKTERRIWSNFS